MRLSRIIMALTVGLAVVAVPTAAGAAQPQQPPPTTTATPQPPVYPPGTGAARLTVSDPTIFFGDTVDIIGDNFGPNERVVITVSYTPLAAGAQNARRSDGSAVAMTTVAAQPGTVERTIEAVTDGNGDFRVEEYKPSVTGRFILSAVGQESRRSDTASLRVLRKKQPALPVTGDSLGTPMKVGGGLVGAGAVMLLLSLAWRRRHRFGGGAAH
ncbi:hypothetical protein [Micromonospora sp. NPDC049799]|uniref:hypothetical protein n=1 Tax=Micromonospora sp. NPDC049799 TaxID=3154741 RepID=UPI0033DE8D31